MRRFTPLLLSFFAFAACDCDDTTTVDADTPEEDTGPVCQGMGGTCSVEADCCEGPCEENVCTMGSCAADGVTCEADADCCSESCEAGVCGTRPMCSDVGEVCVAGSDCCSGACEGDVCVPPASCGTTGDTCTMAGQCCSGFCSNEAGTACAGGSCNCAPPPACTGTGMACTLDAECCNGLCDDPDGDGAGTCANIGACLSAGEPCGTEGFNGSCCSTVCLDTGDGPRCQFLGGCRVQNELCSSDGECCSGSCEQSGTTADGRPITRCANDGSCQPVGEVCGGSGATSNCCPNGDKNTGCEPTGSGFRRCLGGDGACTLPTFECETTEECCKDAYPDIECQPPTDERAGGSDLCCLDDGLECAFGDVCCSGVCALDGTGTLRCGSMCVSDGGSCTTDADCCGCGCVDDGAGGQVCTSDAELCDPCAGPKLGEICDRDGEACCNGPAVVCNPAGEFPTCILAE